jgi:hypothetical protein
MVFHNPSPKVKMMLSINNPIRIGTISIIPVDGGIFPSAKPGWNGPLDAGSRQLLL